ncbi:uncharacterized protein SCHCODRAFT_02614009 [Schizophyllum commune H4-8]|nr:uncharacterized protein SCHCODRAFT_02614009 [Schizophyllum commune H4-8]KAI5896086.1 hypothetical protein SCHCODRAFT_02614009 [Schizophyllum commune H4-8]
MASCPPPGKRARTDDLDASMPPSKAVRHSKHWYRDGSIVLHVENVLFRVHQTLLEVHSEVFRDMSTASQPDGNHMLDGCHVVRLTGDRCEDWVLMLDSLYDAISYCNLADKRLDDTKLRAVSAVLRLATKYRMPTHREKSLKTLSTHFPNRNHFEISPLDAPMLDSTYDIIKLARESNAPTLLPFAFLYISCMREPRHIVHSEKLGAEDKIRILHGILQLVRMQRTEVYHSVDQFRRSVACTASCTLPTYLLPWYGDDADELYWVADGETHKDRVKHSDLQSHLCQTCYETVLEEVTEGEQKMWEATPSIFDLGKSWDDLRQMQNYDT